jgi:hypothetical protein
MKDKESILEDKIVEVRAITRDGSYYTKDHDGGSIFTGATWSCNLPASIATNSLVKILDKDEQAWFEETLNKEPGELNFYKRESPFWNSFTVKLTKEGIKLNLADPIDNLKYRVLKANKFSIAPSWDKRNEDARFRFALVEAGYEDIEINHRQDKIKRAFKAFGKIEDNSKKMKDVLRVFYGNSKKVSQDASMEFLQAEINRLIESKETIDKFLAVTENPKFEITLLLEDAIESRSILRSGKNGYRLPKMEEGTEYVADNLKEMIEWLEAPKNHAEVLAIKAQIKQAKD